MACFDIVLKLLRLPIASLLTVFAYDLTSLDATQPSVLLQLITDYPLVFGVLGVDFRRDDGLRLHGKVENLIMAEYVESSSNSATVPKSDLTRVALSVSAKACWCQPRIRPGQIGAHWPTLQEEFPSQTSNDSIS